MDPAGDFITRSAVPAADLVAVYAARDAQDNLLICAQVRENTASEISYSLRLKALTNGGILTYQVRAGKPQPGWQAARRSGRYVCASVSLADLGNPWAVFLGADTEGGGRIMDQAAWQMILLSESP